MNYIFGLIKEIWILLLEMAPYLILGFFIAGLLYIIISKEKIYKHFSRNNLLSIIKASLFGVPLPLCSCGVIPVAAHLRKEGAGKSSTLSFLTSTPTTGVDSIMATYSLLGPLFAVIRPVAAFIGGIVAGSLNSIFDGEKVKKIHEKYSCSICNIDQPHTHSLWEKVKVMFRYGFFDLVEDVWKWLAIGIAAGGMISFFIPEKIISAYLGSSIIAYPVMLAISIPMYVCATGSIPIAASLILKGMSPGAGLIFLIAGPATNTATLSFVGGKLGKKSLIVYLIAIIFTSLAFGILVDQIWYASGKDMALISGGMKMLPQYVKVGSAIILLLLMVRAAFKKHDKKITNKGMVLKVPDMTCNKCVKTIEETLMKVKGVKEVNINLRSKKVEVLGKASRSIIISTIKKAGYSPGKS
ncbi:MAG: SO_0444 family Cu/Zn efflux transporter [Spirochaetes bacterium]|nr:SO_0444 family Cu/Zn efflux transporter [Spirochaetota bacterium]